MAQYEDLDLVKQSLHAIIDTPQPQAVLDDLRVKFLGPSGVLDKLLKQLGSLPASERKTRGEALNRFKQDVTALLFPTQ